MFARVLALVSLMGCTTIVEPDAGSTDAPAAEIGACLQTGAACDTTSPPCCVMTYTCRQGLCQQPCEPVGSICSDNSQCCNGLCSGTCQ